MSVRNAVSMSRLVAGVFRARRILKEFRPDVVVGTGGYTTAAVLMAQRMLHGKIVIHEQNAIPGKTNLWLARIADRVCVTFDSSAAFFSKEKVVVTGMPIRAEFAKLPSKAEARRALEFDESAFTILVVGGSQGAKRLNELVLEAWSRIDDGSTQVLHQVGARNLDELQTRRADTGNRYRIEAYVDMPVAVAAADIVICRSGASTIAEITAAGLPAILVPFPYAYANHQKLNAEHLAEHGAAIICEESVTSADMLATVITDLRSSPEKRASMSSSSASLAKPDAASEVAKVLIAKAG